MRKRGGRKKSYDTGVAGPLLVLFVLLPFLLSRPKIKKRKRKPTVDEMIDMHFDD